MGANLEATYSRCARDDAGWAEPIVGRNQQEEGNMKIASLIAALVATAALTAFGQEGVVQDVKHGAKKAGETIKDGLETAGQKAKETAQTVGEKTKETGETIVRKTKQAVDGTAEKTADTTQKPHHKPRKSTTKAKAETTEEQARKIDLETPLPSPTP